MKSSILIAFFLVLGTVFAAAQSQNWIYCEPSPGMAKQLLSGADGVCAVGSALTANAGIFIRIYGLPGRDEAGKCVQQTTDGGYVILGWYPDAAVLIKTGPLGDTAWINEIAACQGEFIRQTPDQGYVFTGKQNGFMFLTRTDSLGGVRWNKSYDFQMGRCVSRTADGGYVITGMTNDGMSLALVKTDSGGNQVWSKVYSAPNQSTGLYVEQTSDLGYVLAGFYGPGGSSFYAWLLRTDASGDTLWTRKYSDGLTFGMVCRQTSDGGYALGAMLLMGNKVWLVKTDSQGDSVWTRRFDAQGNGDCDFCEIPGGRGYAVTATTMASDVGLWRLDSQGNLAWQTAFGGAGWDYPNYLTRTADQGFAVCGGSASYGPGDFDIYLVKTDSLGRNINEDLTIMNFSASGAVRWLYQFDGPGKRKDAGYTIVRGPDGNYYAGGFCQDSANTYHSALVSVDSGGNYRWSYVHPAGATSMLIPDQDNACVACGPDGSVYLAAYEGSGSRAAVLSFTGQGAPNWSYHRNNAQIRSLVCGADGNLYAAGIEADTITYQLDFAVLSVSPSGGERWAYRKDYGDADRASAIVCSGGGIYACGATGSAGATDFTCIGIDRLGAERWVYRANTGSEDFAYSIARGPGGYLYAAGGTGDAMTMDLTVVKLDTLGAARWTYDYDGPAGADDWAYAVACGADQRVYAAGWSESAVNHPDLTVVCVDTAGSFAWDYRVTAGWGWSIAPAADQNIYVGGDGWYQQTGHGFSVASLSSPSAVGESADAGPADAGPGLSIFPNPAGPGRGIRFAFDLTRDRGRTASLEIFDAAGRLVQNLTGLLAPAVKNNSGAVDWDGTDAAGRRVPAGVYFCRLSSGEIATAQKLVILR